MLIGLSALSLALLSRANTDDVAKEKSETGRINLKNYDGMN